VARVEAMRQECACRRRRLGSGAACVRVTKGMSGGIAYEFALLGAVDVDAQGSNVQVVIILARVESWADWAVASPGRVRKPSGPKWRSPPLLWTAARNGQQTVSLWRSMRGGSVSVTSEACDARAVVRSLAGQDIDT